MRRPMLFAALTLGLGGAALAGLFLFSNSSTVLFVSEAVLPVQEQQESRIEQTTIEPIQRQRQVPEEVRGVYLTRWSAASSWHVNQVLELAKEGLVNAAVIDIKDFSGFLAYDTNVELAGAIGAEQQNIEDIASWLDLLHQAGLYVIARLTVFQDPVLAQARPELAIKRIDEEGQEQIWTDNKGLAWLDPASQKVWDYNIAIAKDALAQGFDEVNFDYVRFPSDGPIFEAEYPFWDETTPLENIIASFFAYLSAELGEGRTSVDLFGLAAANTWDDMGIGQVLEDAFLHVDFVSPMVYPSHFAQGFLQFERPEEHPYEIVHFSMRRAKERLTIFRETQEPRAKLRPWLQYFKLKGSEFEYDASVVREQIQATKDALGQEYGGYLLWNPANFYPAKEMREIVLGPLQEDADAGKPLGE